MNSYDKGAAEIPGVFVIFGGLGDLSRKKLIPALYSLYKEKKLSENFAVAAIDLRETEEEEFRRIIRESLEEYTRYKIEKESWDSFCQRIFYKAMDLQAGADEYEKLKVFLGEIDQNISAQGNRIFYMAVSPALFYTVTRSLYDSQMLGNQPGNSWERVMIEKPFGRSLETARELYSSLSEILPEEKIFRIDHYLGKEMLQNVLAIRFSNTIFEALWNYQYIDSIQIHAAEEIGIENRGAYYEQSGILRDMLQNHILQMLALVCMEPPVKFEADHIRQEKVKVFQALRFEEDVELSKKIVAGQYGEGENNGLAIPGYRSEKGVASDSRTPTFIAAKLYVDNFRWAGVPIYIRSGKRMGRKSSVIVIYFKKLPGMAAFPIFGDLTANILVIKIQPKEGVALQFNAKKPGNDFYLEKVKMDYCQECYFRHNSPEAYERLILEALLNKKTLFTSWEELEHSWRFTDHLQKFVDLRKSSFPNYKAGSNGPKEAEYLIARDGRKWWDPEQ